LTIAIVKPRPIDTSRKWFNLVPLSSPHQLPHEDFAQPKDRA
jgi:hypothetical protein